MFDPVDKAKNFFLDRIKIIQKVEKARIGVLSRFGAFVRQRAKTSMRKRKKPSPPGTPPSAHVGTLRKLLYFAYDPATQTVVVGPVPFGQQKQSVGVPQVSEYGGTVRRVRAVLVGKGPGRDKRATPRQRETFLEMIRAGRLERAPTVKKTIDVRYPARPFMRPALKAEAPKFPQLFRNQVR